MSPSLQSMPRQTTPPSSAALPTTTLQFPANEPQSYRRIDSLFASRTLAVTDVTCTCPRSPAGALRESGAYQLIFVRRGVFVKHGTARSWPEVAAEPAHVLLLNSGEPYRVSHPSSRGDACTAVAYESRMVAEVAKACGAPERFAARNPFPAGSAVVPPAAILRLHRLRQWLRTPDAIVTPGEVEVEALALLRMVLASAWRQYRSADPAGDDDEMESDVLPGRPDIVETVKQALARYPAAATSLDDLATYIGMSPSHLARVFSRGAGLPVHQYLMRLRLGTALERMSDTSVRMSAIALDAGFSSASHFTNAFHKTFGLTPTQWRASLPARRRTA
jgi:AraC-like DNA-binding protein